MGNRHTAHVVIGILASRADEASVMIARELIAIATDEPVDSSLADRYHLDGAELVVVDERHLDLVAVDTLFDTAPRWIAVVSRHAGDTGPLLTAHFPGNIGTADFGGSPSTVPPACPHVLTAYLAAVTDTVPTGYEVGIECTHHGPTDSDAPIVFVEVGSGPTQWADTGAGHAVASALWSVRDAPSTATHQLVGLGGGHYAPRFERIIRETAWDVGHIAPDWALDALDADDRREILPRLFEASSATHCLLDGDDHALASMVESLGFTVVSERWLRATSKVPPSVLDALETDLAPLDDGLILGDQPVSSRAEYVCVDLPDELLTECVSIDRAATVEAIEASTVAYRQVPGGRGPSGRLAVTAGASVESLLRALIAILSTKYDSVECHDDTIVAQRRAFDPDAATTAGVPPGPLFGRLAAGETVSVDGERIEPASVTVDETVTYPLPAGVCRPSDETS